MMKRDEPFLNVRGLEWYRILYFFHDRNVAVLSHSLTKEDSTPPVEIERALSRKRQFEQNPEKHLPMSFLRISVGFPSPLFRLYIDGMPH
jgi:hypothetical protein